MHTFFNGNLRGQIRDTREQSAKVADFKAALVAEDISWGDRFQKRLANGSRDRSAGKFSGLKSSRLGPEPHLRSAQEKLGIVGRGVLWLAVGLSLRLCRPFQSFYPWPKHRLSDRHGHQCDSIRASSSPLVFGWPGQAPAPPRLFSSAAGPAIRVSFLPASAPKTTRPDLAFLSRPGLPAWDISGILRPALAHLSAVRHR